jgi:hypothetical protein
MRRAAALLLPVAMACLAARTARADGADPAAAAELFRQGREALLENRFDVACPRLAESQRLDPKVGTLINLARCEEAIDKRASAMRHWDDAVKLAHASTDAREPFVTEQRDKIAPSVPRLAVKLAPGVPSDTRVKLDGVEIGPGDLGAMAPVDAGAHVIVATTSAGDRQYPVTIVDDDVVTVTIDPRATAPVVDARSSAQPAAGPTTDAPPSPEAPQQPASRGDTQRLIAYAAGGAAVFALGLGTAWGLQAISARNDSRCTNGQCNQAGFEAQQEGLAAGDRATVAFIVGGVLVAGGVALWLTAPRAKTGLAAWVAPSAQPGGACAGLRGAW